MATNFRPVPLAANPSKNNVVTHRTAIFYREVINGGSRNKYERLNYDKVFLGYRGKTEERNFFSLHLNSGNVSARTRAYSGKDITATTDKANWVDGYDDIEFVDASQVVQFARIGFANI